MAYAGTKVSVLLLFWCFFTFILVKYNSHPIDTMVVLVQPNETLVRSFKLPKDAAEISLEGHIDSKRTLLNKNDNTQNVSKIALRLEWRNAEKNQTYGSSSVWNVYLDKSLNKFVMVHKTLKLSPAEVSGAQAVISLESNSDDPVALLMKSDPSPLLTNNGVLYATILLIALYGLIVLELCERTFAGLIVATTSIAILALIGNRPTLHTIVSCVDFETLMLLFGMMIMVAILSGSGLFDWLAVLCYRVSKGQPWPLLFFLSMFTAILSAVLDNVTMLLLMAPIAIKLCETMAMRVSLVIIVVVVFSNIGGALTPVGDPPNVIIATNKHVLADGIDFAGFTLHMLPAVTLSAIVCFLVVYLMMRKTLFALDDKQIMLAQQHELDRAAAPAETLQRVKDLMDKEPARPCIKPASNFFIVLATLESQYRVHDIPLMIKSLVALSFAILCFLLHSLPFMPGANLGWIAVLAALLLLILANMDDIEGILEQVEWSALLFLAALFVLTESVEKLGFIEWLGRKSVKLITMLDERSHTAVTITLILWMSAFLSAIVGNVPVTTMLMKLVIEIVDNAAIRVPMSPLIWALSCGACLGGNGTLIGAAANVVGAAIAHHHGYRVSFVHFFVNACPLMLTSLVCANVYLLVAHCLFSWHKPVPLND
ncbi:hypothetical protein KR018_004306 [Drosophila ironensis]|nr:hypothetical protein KR018_004306 [Drosophila ironensis]